MAERVLNLRTRPPTSYSTLTGSSYPSCTYGYDDHNTTTTSRPRTLRSTARPSTARPRTSASTIARIEAQTVICAVAESRGISPTVGISFVNLDTGEAVLCQICDSQTYVKTIHKLRVYGPSEILIMATAASPKSKLFSIIEENLDIMDSKMTLLDRKYWAEGAGFDYIKTLALDDDVEAIKLSVSGSFYAVLKYIELGLNIRFPFHSLRMKYEPSEGSMMIDISTIHSLELVQNLQNPKSRDCLFGLLNETQTPMGGRLLRSNILQPLTDVDTLSKRYDAVDELQIKEDMFYATRSALQNFLDTDRILTAPTIQTTEQSINQIIMLKQFVTSVNPIYQALTGARSWMLNNIRELCAPENVIPVVDLINGYINEDTAYARQPLELRNQRNYAVKSGVNGLLDVARTTYKESMEDAYQHATELSEQYDIKLDLKYEAARRFYIRISASELEDKVLPPVFTNVFKKRNVIECQTVELMKRNQKKLTGPGDEAVQTLIEELSAFAHLVTVNDYGNVPASSASFPILHNLFARVGMDDSIESNVSTFAAEMREIAFILRNLERRSMAIIDELGRGTSTRDGLAIAIAIAEALVDSRALVWFATHFKDLATILSERNGVICLHLAVEISNEDTMTMLYRAVEGSVQESHYGLALARVVPLPPQVLADATHFAHKLERRLHRKKKTSKNVINERRRKLILDLKEHLVQAYNGTMEGELLATWLKELQKEFVNRMTAINEDERAVWESEEEDVDGDVEMGDESSVDEEMLDVEERLTKEPSVVSINSSVTSTESESTVRQASDTMSSVRAVSENL
ncbi:MutS protein msh4 [Kalmusia sp. IMI 367209]|nr:MutS protein msh4 [Kalmusia sp. IMI 367209]